MNLTNSTIKPEKKILGISGSPRRNGNSDILLQEITRGAEETGAVSDIFNLTRLTFQGCIGCEKCRKDKICTGLKDDMTPIYNNIIQSQGLVLVCPTHNYNVTSWMKAFIDRMYCFYNFEDDRPRSWSSQLSGQKRLALVAAICEQENKEDMGFTLEAMTQPLKALGYEIVNELAVFRIFDKGGVKTDQQSMENAFSLGQTFAEKLLSSS